jgi:glycosyltransferase involved in cell wall biosynthesis
MNVIIASPNKPDLPDMEFEIQQYHDDIALEKLVKKADIILCQGMVFNKFESLRRKDKFLILDIYDPYNLATLEEYSSRPIKERIEIHGEVVKTINEQLYWGDFFLCASERQRDFWLGMLSALNRVNPITYYADSTLRKTIDVVSFGLPENKPVHSRKVLKGVTGNIKEDDFVIIWGGGIYNWFDPLSLIRAMKLVGDKREDIKLFFMGLRHPNPMVKELSLVNETIDLAKSSGVFEKNVFFNFGWVKYNERQNYLLESDVGIITHPIHIETRFSFRTRVLDYMWAGLPIISTEGDFFSELIEKEKIGLTVKEKDPEDIARAIIRLADDKELYENFVKNISVVSKKYSWEKVCAPLLKFCQNPVISAVKDPGGSSDSNGPESLDAAQVKRGLISKFCRHFFKSGPKKTFSYVSNYLRNK